MLHKQKIYHRRFLLIYPKSCLSIINIVYRILPIFSMRGVNNICFLIIVTMTLLSCTPLNWERNKDLAMRDPIDREANLTRTDFKEGLRPYDDNNKKDITEEEEDAILPFYDIVLAPEAPQIPSSKLVTLAISEDINLKDVLIELARLADLELSIDPRINTGIILYIKDRPVNEAIELIAEKAKLKWEIDDGILSIERDAPYLINYSVDFLNLTRSVSGSLSTQTNVLSVSADTSGLNSGTSNTISYEYDGDMWTSIEANIQSILGLKASGNTADEEGEEDTLVDLGSAVGPTLSEGDEEQASVSTANVLPSSDAGFYYTINKQAGIISANATFAKHRLIKDYIEHIKMSLATQVLIEAKIIEVTLTEGYSTGIDWSGSNRFTSPSDLGATFLDGDTNPFSFSKNIFNSMTTALTFIEKFGTIRALSNPRLTAMNNQQAIFTFARNKPYFTIEAEDESDTDNSTSTVTITSTLNTVPIGIIMSIQPSINLDTQEITLNVRPTVSSDLGETFEVKDPAVSIIASRVDGGSDIESKIPTIQVRELDTVLKIKNDEVMVIGGLLQHEDTNNDQGAPFFSNIPIIGNLAKKTQKETTVKELIILITAKIVTPEGYMHDQDKRIYNRFSQDPRPLTF